MTDKNTTQSLVCPEGVSAQVENSVLSVTGSKGVVTRNFLHPKVIISAKGNGIDFSSKKFTLNEKKIMNTYKAHVRNMFKGVTEGHEYKLKICSGHFPMNVSLKGSTFEVKNFIGEAVPRLLVIKQGAEVKVNGDTIVVTGIDKELVAQTAASIETLTRRNGFDRRVFQDGIYIIEKDGKAIS